jgi:hypothetical protein
MSRVAQDQFARLLQFVGRLERERISYQLGVFRSEAVCVFIAVPGQRWEVEFMEDGGVEVERFVSEGNIGGEAQLEELLRELD